MKFASDGNYQVIFWLFGVFKNGSWDDSTTAGGGLSSTTLTPSVVNLSKLGKLETD